MKNKQFIYKYWSRTELGGRMIASNNVSEADLLFLMPNNIKRMHGLPMTRIIKCKHKKRKYKAQLKRYILSWRLFDIIEETVNEIIGQQLENKPFYNEFVYVRNMPLGDKVCFDLSLCQKKYILPAIDNTRLMCYNTCSNFKGE